MLKLILKNLWARRRRNGWLLAELILVSIVTWIILDPVIVTTYDRSIPLGYDTDRLCLVTLSTLQPQAPGYDEEAEDSAMIMKSYFNLTRLVKDYPGVPPKESITPTSSRRVRVCNQKVPITPKQSLIKKNAAIARLRRYIGVTS